MRFMSVLIHTFASPAQAGEIVLEAALRGARLRAQGGDTKRQAARLACAEPEAGAGAFEAICSSAYSGIVSYEPTELVVTAKAGTPLLDLQAALAEEGQALAFEPPIFGPHSTLGGAVASGMAGPSRASAGGVRDFVLGVELVNGRGEVLRFGGQVMKNVAGYDVSRLMAGSWGGLGLATEVSLKVLPAPLAQASFQFEATQQQALDALNAWGGLPLPLPLSASCWLPAAQGASGQLVVRVSGAAQAVAAAPQAMQASSGMAAAPLEAAPAAALWSALRHMQHPFFTQPPSPAHELWRMSLPQTAAAVLGFDALVEWHGGQRWVWAKPKAASEVVAAAANRGGYAIKMIAACASSTAQNADFSYTTTAADARRRLNAQVRLAFDPRGIWVAAQALAD